jgi:pilus assembly protein FimV
MGQSGQSGASGASSSAAAAAGTNVDVNSSVTASAVAPGSAGASSTTPAANNALKEPVAKNSGEAKTALAKVKEYASDHLLGLVLGVSALLALLIAFLLKRAGKNARVDELDQEPRDHPGLASDFDQKLQSIDLNLSDSDKSALTSGPPKTGV